jgi:hypothetical protein
LVDGRRLELPTSALRTNGGSGRISLSVRDVNAVSPHREGRALDGTAGRWDSDHMTQAAKKLLDEFDALQEGDRAEVLAELLRRVALSPHELPDSDDLVAAADEIFVELDRRERSQ